ncbi:phosphoadenosine phosphosulfate reductase [Pseudodonghicola flavimaris]|uniref:Phosphoadenosine phosphosulfate reductase n=1 Tax=Pseudodonghicola flavimaris TaxID=3050036 RepID=A0ABT7EV85_9RHOB|nr:phosphoadenosine phosphosulfate reductase [Pseudodonghicola flavimaris]MDK3016246.1 phosphoadenosine phosphosulfate reductase [Pseudodonghicola flavimaris]
MQDEENGIDSSLADLDKAAWREALLAQAEAHGMAQELGKRHFATFIDKKPILLVTFETIQGIRALSETAQPFGFDMVKAQGWSHLCVISDGDTWFRDDDVYGFFDQLIDDGFFEDFERVIFYGAGPCGYAAATYSVASPGATVIAVQPQATLEPRMTEWDDRFTELRRTDFTSRYGYAPDMLDAAGQAFILYDPRQTLDAMHATLFARANVTRLRLPFMGGALQTQLMEMKILYRLLSLAGAEKLTEKKFFELYRARRDHIAYLRNLMSHLDQTERPYLNILLCRNVTSRMWVRRFRRRLVQLEQQAAEGSFKAPPPPAE